MNFKSIFNANVSSGSVNINGKIYSGNNIQITNGRVVVDGVSQDGDLPQSIEVTVNGDVELLETGSGNVKANNVGEINTGSGDVDCGNVSGNIRTGSGDVSCADVKGSIRTGSGDVYRS